ncbi:magnesium transporter CorA family protein [Clostridium sp. CX1]|uniref:Magnesium transporter CorA family protein n=1 Tax=Clostridium tanneri TaxID=3037988 RepID=A0ABU4JQH4_9CLOT|nr:MULTISPECIES: magnesium transporter CorA family protein [unclassified Clostridium]MCT8977633.1 magnesium transporter CorA family protein [Clostridium sp. CX1]MDW8800404.1 magnesium transporter CorA family protein [Clostridium sp. A1-XYC3]
MKIFDLNNNFKDVTNNFKFNGSHYWILVHVDELEKVKEIILLDEDSLAECKNFSQSSKISFYEDYVFIVLNILEYCREIVTSKELNVFLGEDYLVTICKDRIDIVENLIKDIGDFKNCFMLRDKPRVCILLYYILDRIIVNNYNVISSLESEADKIEISILKNPRHEQIDNLITLRRQVYKIKKYLNPLRYIGDSLVSNDNLIIEKENIGHFVSLNKKIDKLMLALENLVQDLALVREAFESEIANKTNELMKVFTVIATIFLPLNLITSMYGMNLKGIPLMEIEHGCYYVVFFMISIACTLILIFKKKKWL